MPLQRFHQGFPSLPVSHLCGTVSSKSKSTEVSDSLLFLPVARERFFLFLFSEDKTNSGLEVQAVDFKCVCFPPYQPGISKAETPGSFQCPLKTRHIAPVTQVSSILYIYIFTSILNTSKGHLFFLTLFIVKCSIFGQDIDWKKWNKSWELLQLCFLHPPWGRSSGDKTHSSSWAINTSCLPTIVRTIAEYGSSSEKPAHQWDSLPTSFSL